MSELENCSSCGQPKKKLGFFAKMVYIEYKWKSKLVPKLMPFQMCHECHQKIPKTQNQT